MEDELSRSVEFEAFAFDATTAPATQHGRVAVPTRAERFALRVLQLGAVVVVLAAAAYRPFELDRFFVPKELTLHLTALLAGLATLPAFRRVSFTGTDLLIFVFLLLGIASAVQAANPWLAARAVAISASGVALFWTARALASAGLGRPLLTALATAVVVGSATSLLQAYGVRTDFFALDRAPGGTLGNRNFVAHMAAFGLPVVLLVGLSARGIVGYVATAVAAGLVTGSLVLTRSRAGFLAFAAVLLVFLAAPLVSPVLRQNARTWLRLAGLVIVAAAAVTGAVLVPNTLRWRSDNPYLESLTGVTNYQEGSGRGRLVQYRQSIRMAARHPVLGVGPGNWSVEYPAHAARRDPSMDHTEPGTTSNPWPSSDWVAFAAERGLPATLLLGIAFLGIAVAGMKQLARASDAHEAVGAAALLGTLLAAGVAGTFDAVLLLALPTLLVWSTLGALWQPATGLRLPAFLRVAAAFTVALLAGGGAARSAAQLGAMTIYEHSNNVALLSRAAVIDPGNYRLRLRLARPGTGLGRKTRCVHARAARELLPRAAAARALSRGCGR